MKNIDKYWSFICDEISCNFKIENLGYSRDDVGMCSGDCADCDRKLKNWLQEEYTPKVDWSKVEVDTPVLVGGSSEGSEWLHRHFAKYEDGVVRTWNGGETSWTTKYPDITIGWAQAKLANDEDEKVDEETLHKLP